MDFPTFLIGFMGSGKTSLGRRLAKYMKVEFVDLDQKIVLEERATIKTIFARNGAGYFRKIEMESLQKHLNFPGIVASGGGCPLYFDNMDQMLNNGLVVYLKLPAEELLSRLSVDYAGRPLLKGLDGAGLKDFISKQLAYREPVYNKAHITVDAETCNAKSLAALIKAYTR